MEPLGKTRAALVVIEAKFSAGLKATITERKTAPSSKGTCVITETA